MAPKITLAVLSNQINNMHSDLKEIKTDVKLNNAFRLQAKGFAAAIIFIAGTLGGVVTITVSKLLSLIGRN